MTCAPQSFAIWIAALPTPEAPAVEMEGESLTYRELGERSALVEAPNEAERAFWDGLPK